MSMLERTSTAPAADPAQEAAPRARGVPMWLVCLAMGGLAALGQPPLHFWPLTLVGIVWLVRTLDEVFERPGRLVAGFFRSFLFGLGYFLVSMHWIGAPFLQVEAARDLAPLGLLLLPVLALFWGLAGLVAQVGWTRDARRIPWFAAVFTSGEWLRGHLFGGLPWVLPGYIWEAGGPISQIASMVGIYGLTALTLLVFATPMLLLDSRIRVERRLTPVLAAMFAMGFAWATGAQTLAQAPQTPGDFSVRVLDSGFSQAEKWAPEGRWAVFQRYLDLTGPAGPEAAQVVVWPESAIPGLYVQNNTLSSPEVAQILGAHLDDRVLITGLIRVEERAPAPPLLYNSAAVLDAVNGELRLGQIYDKVRLVPFGEFIPLLGVLDAMGFKIAAVQQIGSGFTAGPTPTRLAIPGAAPASPLICYEAIFPGFLNGRTQGDWLVNLTNDAWFSYGRGWPVVGPLQHYNQARYRAIELGLPLARAASGGVSAIIDPFGREIARTGLDGGAVEAVLPQRLSKTVFTSWGFLLTPFLLLALGGLRLVPGRGQRGRIL